MMIRRLRMLNQLCMMVQMRTKYSESYMPSLLSGMDYIRDPNIYKGLAFTMSERQELRIHGLIPPRVLSQDAQIEWVHDRFETYGDNLRQYMYLMSVLDRNEHLFYSFLTKYIEKTMPIVYTPTVGLACERFGLVYRRPRGMFITIFDKGNVLSLFKNWPELNVKVIVVTDGERILGLGDLGLYGMGIPIGKLNLYTALAGIPPNLCLPIVIDVGTNNEKLLNTPFYIGLSMPRVGGQDYDDLIEEFMEAATQRFGTNLIIQFEDFAFQNAYRLLNKYRDRYCTFNDDIQGTAAVALAGLLAAVIKSERKLADHVVLFYGAGSAAQGIANLIVLALETQEGKTKKEAYDRIWMMDKDGLLTHSRDNDLNNTQKLFAKDHKDTKSLLEVVKSIKATTLIGVSTAKGAFTHEVMEAMTENCEQPIIFAMSNPTSKAECTPKDAITATKGRCIFSSGSPFPPTEYEGKKYYTSQGNNAYIFPGIGLGIICTGVYRISDEMFLVAAQTLAQQVTKELLDVGAIYPRIRDIPRCSIEIAKRLMKCSYECGSATVHPEPTDYEAYIRTKQYNLSYLSYTAPAYAYPDLQKKEKKTASCS